MLAYTNIMMDEGKFKCAACGNECDHELATHECHICGRFYCDACMNEEGICALCEEEKKEQTSCL
jgi:hypothetical protein